MPELHNPLVGGRKMTERTVSNALVGIAGVHYVAAELSRRGLIALPTIRNTAGYDIIVATHANRASLIIGGVQENTRNYDDCGAPATGRERAARCVPSLA
jgi:hypothetical protein